MQESDKTLNPDSMRRLEERIPSNDTLHERLDVGRHYGSIEAAEEKRFPWLKKRRSRRVTR